MSALDQAVTEVAALLRATEPPPVLGFLAFDELVALKAAVEDGDEAEAIRLTRRAERRRQYCLRGAWAEADLARPRYDVCLHGESGCECIRWFLDSRMEPEPAERLGGSSQRTAAATTIERIHRRRVDRQNRRAERRAAPATALERSAALSGGGTSEVSSPPARQSPAIDASSRPRLRVVDGVGDDGARRLAEAIGLPLYEGGW